MKADWTCSILRCREQDRSLERAGEATILDRKLRLQARTPRVTGSLLQLVLPSTINYFIRFHPHIDLTISGAILTWASHTRVCRSTAEMFPLLMLLIELKQNILGRKYYTL